MNKHLNFPLTSKTNEDGVRDFINEMGNGIIYTYIYIYFDKVGLEDWTTSHEADFEIIDGYHFNSGRKMNN